MSPDNLPWFLWYFCHHPLGMRLSGLFDIENCPTIGFKSFLDSSKISFYTPGNRVILLGTEWYQKNLVSSPITQFIKYFKLVLSLLSRFFLIFFNYFSNFFFCLKPWSKIHKEHLHQVLYWSNWSPRKCWNAKVFLFVFNQRNHLLFNSFLSCHTIWTSQKWIWLIRSH